MANIMVTKRCNLNCEYCFANEFVNESVSDGEGRESDIAIDDFKKISDFILGDGSETKLGLIGGEPTLHKAFGELLDILIEEERAKDITVYTNGIKGREFIRQLENPKFHLLINCNDIAEKKHLYGQFLESLCCIFERLPERTVLGLNYYKIDYDYSYLLELLKSFPCKRLRLSISVPNTGQYGYEPLEYFEKIKASIFSFFKELKALGVIPFLDCNIFPACLVTAEEMREFQAWGTDNPLSILKNRRTGCAPVIDILPDFTAVRCFGLSEYTKADIRDFASISDLRNYYIRTLDAYAVNAYHNPKCASCYKHKTMKCSGGCLIYKIKQILEKRKGQVI